MNTMITGDPVAELTDAWKPFQNQLSFRLASLDKIPNAHGLYGFWYHRRCIYVGQAKKQLIAERLEQHWKSSHNKHLSEWIKAYASDINISYFTIECRSDIDTLERFYIDKFQPHTNIHHS